MLELRFIRENEALVRSALGNRGSTFNLDGLLALDRRRRQILTDGEILKHQRNDASEKIGKLLAEKKDAAAPMAEAKILSQKVKELDAELAVLDAQTHAILLTIPNIPQAGVPVGRDAAANQIVRSWGKPREFDFPARDHVAIAEALDVIDFQRASKISGSHFILFKKDGARLERALINFMLDLQTQKHGYMEIFPPFLVNRASMTGTGQVPKFEEDMYRLKDDDLFLVPTAEVPLTNLYANEVLEEEDLPINLTAYTACFRREAGAYGKETRGMLRVHQFDKIELVKFVHPSASYEEHEKLLGNAETVLQLLGLPYRVSLLSTGDIGFSASKCYDLEAWASGTKGWLEVSSCSNFEAFQARRANIRFREKATKKVGYVHTLNGSGLALARTFICILENYQQKDGSVLIPEILRPYLGGQERIG